MIISEEPTIDDELEEDALPDLTGDAQEVKEILPEVIKDKIKPEGGEGEALESIDEPVVGEEE